MGRPRMAGAETTVEKLRKFLRELSPGARSLLVGELERNVLRGDEVAGGDLVLQELRRIMREQRDGAARLDESAQLLFKPLEPFLVDDRGDHKHPGRVQSRHCGVGSSVTCFQTTRRLWPPTSVTQCLLGTGQRPSGSRAFFRIALLQPSRQTLMSPPKMRKFAGEYCSRSVLRAQGANRECRCTRLQTVSVCIADGNESNDGAVAIDPVGGQGCG